MSKTKAIVLTSGGIDSTVALWWAVKQGWEITPLTFNYFARPKIEIVAMKKILERTNARDLITVPLDFMKEVEDLLKNGIFNDNLRGAPSSYIPARNLVFYSLGAYYSEVIGAELLVGGHNNGDPSKFPDSSSQFFKKLDELFSIGLWSYCNHPVKTVLPLKDKKKHEIIQLGIVLEAPLELTWSCNYDFEKPCGKCSSCLERGAAFKVLGKSDPSQYR